MTREEWAVLVKAMKAVYTSPAFLPDQYAFDTWYGLLKDLDYKLLSFGLKKYMQTEWKEPSIAALRQCAQSVAPQKEELNETEAWKRYAKLFRTLHITQKQSLISFQKSFRKQYQVRHNLENGRYLKM